MLAHHALAAGLPLATFRHSLAAGRAALRLAAPREAIVHFERAGQLVREAALPEPPTAAEMQELNQQLGQAYALNGQPNPARAL